MSEVEKTQEVQNAESTVTSDNNVNAAQADFAAQAGVSQEALNSALQKAQKEEEKALKKAEKKASKKMTKKEIEARNEAILSSMQSEDMKAIATLLMDIKSDNARQMKYIKRQMHLSLFSSILCLLIVVALFIGVIRMAPTVKNIADNVQTLLVDTDTIIKETNTVVVSAQAIMQNLSTVSEEVASADLTGMIENINQLVITSEESMGAALETVQSIDIQSLNNAIGDLRSVVEPLAKLFGKK